MPKAFTKLPPLPPGWFCL